MQVQTSDNKIVTINTAAFMEYSNYFIHLSECEQSNEPLQMEIESHILIKINNLLAELLTTKPTEIPKPIPSKKLEQFLNPVEANFLKSLDKLERQHFLKAAHYLNITHLCNLLITSFAADCIGFTTQEFIQELGLKVNYNQEMEAQIQENCKQYLKAK